MISDSANYHADYPDIKRYWSDRSQKFAGGDNLLTMVQRGWQIDGTVYEEDHWHAGTRLVTVYHFTLVRGEQRMVMPVITTPYIRRIMRTYDLKLLPISERREQREQRYAGHG